MARTVRLVVYVDPEVAEEVLRFAKYTNLSTSQTIAEFLNESLPVLRTMNDAFGEVEAEGSIAPMVTFAREFAFFAKQEAERLGVEAEAADRDASLS